MQINDLLFPPLCVGCRCELRAGAFCDSCRVRLPVRHSIRCPHCELRLPYGQLPPRCRNILNIDRLIVSGPYAHPLLRAAIDAFKYDAIRDVADTLALLLLRQLTPIVKDTGLAILVPIPLHPKRLRERGFNQSELLARHIAEKLPVRIESSILTRQRATQQQVRLSPQQREENMVGAFTATPSPLLRSHAIILIDDVVTTGATMREAARTLRRVGARNIWAAAVAQG